MQKKGLKVFGKLLTVGALALGITVSAGAAPAAAADISVHYKVVHLTGNSNIDVNALLRQYLQQLQFYPGSWQPVAHPAAKPAAKPVSKPAAKPATAPVNTGTTTTAKSFASQVVDMVNQERAKAGLKALKSNAALTNMALVKATDLKKNNYFDHNSPTYGSPFDMMKKFGITYRYAGENIAMGQRTPKEVMTGWMNSPGHRANILSANFTSIGVAYYSGEWVQEFTG